MSNLGHGVCCCVYVSEKFQQNVASAQFSVSKSQPLAFSIDHYAGKVNRRTYLLYVPVLVLLLTAVLICW